MKACTKCGEIKPLSDFYPRRDRPGGFTASCKNCQLAFNRLYIKENSEARREYKKQYRGQSADEINAYNKSYYDSNHSMMLQRARDFRARYPEKIKAANVRSQAQLGDGYIASQLGMRLDNAPPHLIHLKRDQLIIYRISRQLKQALIQKESK